MVTKARKKKKKISISEAVAHIKSTFNNTIVTVTDMQGNVIIWYSAGTVGFKGARKNTPYAAQLAAQKACDVMEEIGVETISIIVKGPGAGRDSALRAIGKRGFNVKYIKDATSLPHNGCRPPKVRRV